MSTSSRSRSGQPPGLEHQACERGEIKRTLNSIDVRWRSSDMPARFAAEMLFLNSKQNRVSQTISCFRLREATRGIASLPREGHSKEGFEDKHTGQCSSGCT